MADLWYALVAAMLAAWVVFDGFDLGAGAVHLFAARGERERRAVLGTIGPVWDGNEVWLLAAGGTLYFAFPALYAAAFSGFYLPLMMVLWLLVFRGISIEFRNHIDSPVWRPLWDAVFALSSLLLALFLGAALGNVVRGVPFDGEGRFFLPLWTDFGTGGATGVLDWYTVLTGLFAVAALSHHGARWVALKTDGGLRNRARSLAGRAWWASAALAVAATAATFRVQPLVPGAFADRPWVWGFPALALAGLAGARVLAARGDDLRAFLASCLFLAAMFGTAVAGIHPVVLPSTLDPSRALTVAAAAAPEYGLRVGLAWWIPGMILVAVYFTWTYRKWAGKADPGESGY